MVALGSLRSKLIVSHLAVIGLVEVMFLLAPVEFQEFAWTFLLQPGSALALTALLLGIGCRLVEGRGGWHRGGGL